MTLASVFRPTFSAVFSAVFAPGRTGGPSIPYFYFRPGGVDRYLRPDGVSFYLRP